ncbi:extracellular solute-binding protein [Clostridium sp.]|uniref:ABC transporter substrate-binding protein n=1 Tax=Clostridium sp. TaxID=1506 RepID=UPI00321641CF
MIIIRNKGIYTLIIIMVATMICLTTYSENIIMAKAEDNELISNNLKAPFYPWDYELPNIETPKGFNWREFEGTTLNFVVENNINANILSRECRKFTEKTGIRVNIRPMDYTTMIEKINTDFISQRGKFQLVYVDPYQTINRFYNSLEDLNLYNNDPKMPHIPGGIDDFFDDQVNILSYFSDKNKLCAIPFDTTTMIFFYRKDIFEKYREQFIAENGFDWTPGEKDFTWERYCIVSKWIDENVPDEEVKYGSAQMAQLHNSVYCDFSNVLASYGGNYFDDPYVNTLGIEKPKMISVQNDKFEDGLNMYKQMVEVGAPDSLNWNWTDTAEAFKNGEVAMMANWDENAAVAENPNISKVAGKVGYSILPYGTEKSANIYGGAGIGINSNATEIEKKAAWLFIVWATAPQTQIMVLGEPEGGSMPPRKSVYNSMEVQNIIESVKNNTNEISNLNHLPTLLEVWKADNVYFRSKISNFYFVEQIIINNVRDMVNNDLDPKVVADKIFEELSLLQ